MRRTTPTDNRSEADHICLALQWELTRLAYFQRTGNHAKRQECAALAAQWKAKRDELWLEAQQ